MIATATKRNRLASEFKALMRLGRTRKSFRDFLGQVQNTTIPQKSYAAKTRLEKVYHSEYITGVTKAALGENQGTTGGYLVPAEHSFELLRPLNETSILYPRATVLPMSKEELLAPYVDVEDARATNTAPFFGGMKYGWGASPTPSETDPQFKGILLKAWDLIGNCVASSNLVEDVGPAGERFLYNLFGEAAKWQAEWAFFQGLSSANGQPLGIINSPALISQARHGTSTIVAIDVANMAADLLPSSWENAIWCCSPSCLAQIGVISQYYVNAPNPELYGKAHAGYLMTRPLFITDKLPSMGTANDLLLLDPSLYVIGDRQQVVIDASDQDPTVFTKRQTMFRVWLRIDGKPAVANSITLSNGDKVSPFVGLAH